MNTKWQGKSKTTPLGLRIFVFILRYMGVRPAYGLLYFVALYFFLFSWNSSKPIFRYYRDRHRYSRIKALFSIYKTNFWFGQTLIDKVVMMAGIPNTFTFDFDGETNLHKMVEQGKGGILISGHVGNWEIAGHLLQRINAPIYVVMVDAEHARIKNYLETVTGARKFTVIPIKEDLSHVYAIGEALQKNGLVCLHADRFLEGNKTATHTFLGTDAKFPEGPFLLAASFQVPVSIVFAFKESTTHYHFYGSELLYREPAEAKRDFIHRLSSTFVEQLEEKIKMYPQQWFNYFNFWEN